MPRSHSKRSIGTSVGSDDAGLLVELNDGGDVDVSMLPDGAVMSLDSGLISGGEVTISSGGATFDVAAGTGVIFDWTDPLSPTRTEVSWIGYKNVVATNMATSDATRLYIDSAGDLQQSDYATPIGEELRENIGLPGIIHIEGTEITHVRGGAIPAYQQAVAALEFIRAIGVLNSGNVYSPNGTNLLIDKSFGVGYLPYINRHNNTQSPIREESAAQSPIATFLYMYLDGAGGHTTASSAGIDPDNYDTGSGILTPVSNNRWTIQRIYYFWSIATTFVSYGQAQYQSQADAEAALTTENPDVSPLLDHASYTTALVVKKGETDLTSEDTLFLLITSGGSSVSGVTSHAHLTGLSDDDHLHYLPTDGSRPMAGQLDMDNDDIVGAQNLNGIDVTTGVLNSAMYGTAWPSTPADGQLFFKTDLADPELFTFDAGSGDWYSVHQRTFLFTRATLTTSAETIHVPAAGVTTAVFGYRLNHDMVMQAIDFTANAVASTNYNFVARLNNVSQAMGIQHTTAITDGYSTGFTTQASAGDILGCYATNGHPSKLDVQIHTRRRVTP